MAAGGNRNVLNCEIGADGKRDWSHGLFDYTDECGLCMSTSLVNSVVLLTDPISLSGCWSTWCPCVVYTKNKQRLEHLQSRGTPLVGGGEALDGGCCLYACLGYFGCAFALQVC